MGHFPPSKPTVRLHLENIHPPCKSGVQNHVTYTCQRRPMCLVSPPAPSSPVHVIYTHHISATFLSTHLQFIFDHSLGCHTLHLQINGDLARAKRTRSGARKKEKHQHPIRSRAKVHSSGGCVTLRDVSSRNTLTLCVAPRIWSGKDLVTTVHPGPYVEWDDELP